MKTLMASIYRISRNKRGEMDNPPILPATVICVFLVVLGAAVGVVYLSGSAAPLTMRPANLAPLESPTPYTVGDLVRSADASHIVMVTGYDAGKGVYSYQTVLVDFHNGDLHIMEDTGTMVSEEFETRYPEKIYLNT
jgi:hypothetical protein